MFVHVLQTINECWSSLALASTRLLASEALPQVVLQLLNNSNDETKNKIKMTKKNWLLHIYIAVIDRFEIDSLSRWVGWSVWRNVLSCAKAQASLASVQFAINRRDPFTSHLVSSVVQCLLRPRIRVHFRPILFPVFIHLVIILINFRGHQF